MVKFKNQKVNNPKTFISLCFIVLKKDKSFKQRSDVCVLVLDLNKVGIFKCAYGYFIVDKQSRKPFVNSFFNSALECQKIIKSKSI